MYLAADVCYGNNFAVAAGVLFDSWNAGEEITYTTEVIKNAEPYKPGSFYLRELPCLLKLLARLEKPDIIIIDGYVWLDSGGRPGLGAYLFHTLDQKTPVIGVAKSVFGKAIHAIPVLRGLSKRPIFITAAGIDPSLAAEKIRLMHGPNRIPTLLKRVDQLCRKEMLKLWS